MRHTSHPTRPTRPRQRFGTALLGLSLIVQPGWTRQPTDSTHSTALQSCPSVRQEIVDLDMLAKGLKDSSAVGLFEKIRLKAAIDQMIERMKAFHGGTKPYTLAELQEQYDLLMMRIATQLQGKDPTLHGQLCNAWDSIWAAMQDRNRFMKEFS